MKLDVTSITLICIAALIFLYLVSRNGNRSIHNSGSLNGDGYDDLDSYDGSSYDETEVSSAETDKMTGKNSARGGSYRYSSYDRGTRGGSSEGSLDAYFEPVGPTSGSNNGYSAMDSGEQSGPSANSGYASYSGSGQTSEDDMFNAEELLPGSSSNSYFDTYDNVKVGNSQLINVYRPIGTNTVMGTNRNPTWDLRGEMANPKRNVGPWNNSTMQPNIYKTGICSR